MLIGIAFHEQNPSQNRAQPLKTYYRVLQVKILKLVLASRMLQASWKDPNGAIQRLQGPIDPLVSVKIEGKPAGLDAVKIDADAKIIVRIDEHPSGTTTSITGIEQ